MWKFLAELFSPATPSPVQNAPAQQLSIARAGASAGAAGARQRLDRRTRYIHTQALQLAERFSKDGGAGIELDEQNYNWLIIPKYPMPERWQQRWTKLMILFPAAYPDVPPTGFYLTIQKGLKRGGQDNHLFKGGGYYAEAPDLSHLKWHWYCVHAQVQGAGGWQPSADPTLPDNLFTFLNMVREALTTNE